MLNIAVRVMTESMAASIMTAYTHPDQQFAHADERINCSACPKTLVATACLPFPCDIGLSFQLKPFHLLATFRQPTSALPSGR